MTSDKSLVERLRERVTSPSTSAVYEAGINTHLLAPEPDALAIEAADTIERLEREKEEAVEDEKEANLVIREQATSITSLTSKLHAERDECPNCGHRWRSELPQ